MSGKVTISRSWLLNVCNLVGYRSAGSNIMQAQSIYEINRMLRGAAGIKYGWTDLNGGAVGSPTHWVCHYSCDATTAGTVGDGVDRWTDYTKVNWQTATNPHSWMVLYNAAAGLYWLLNCANPSSNADTLDMWVSKVGFTGGATNARPTATDEQNMLNSTQWGSGGGFPIRFHVMISSDGVATRLFTTRAGNFQGLWAIEPLANPTTNLENSLLAVAWGGAGANAASATTLSQTATTLARKTGGPSLNGVLTGEGSRYALGMHVMMSQAERPLYNDIAESNQLGAINVTGVGYPTRGKLGTIVDLWWGSDNVAAGRSFPGDYTRQLITMGPLVIPWNRSLPELH